MFGGFGMVLWQLKEFCAININFIIEKYTRVLLDFDIEKRYTMEQDLKDYQTMLETIHTIIY